MYPHIMFVSLATYLKMQYKRCSDPAANIGNPNHDVVALPQA